MIRNGLNVSYHDPISDSEDMANGAEEPNHLVSPTPALGGGRAGYPALGTAPRNYRTAAQHTPLLTNRLRPGMLAKRRRKKEYYLLNLIISTVPLTVRLVHLLI